jgi:hypothetical protein
MKKNIYKVFLILSTIEGFIALVFIFQIPSMERNVLVFGFSRLRLLLALFIMLILAFLIWVTIRLLISQTWSEKVIRWIEEGLLIENRLVNLLVSLLVIFIIGTSLLFFFSTDLPEPSNFISVVFKRSRSVIVWVTVMCLQEFLFLIILYGRTISQRKIKCQHVLGMSLVVLMLFAALLHWTVLWFKLPLFTSIQDWFWRFSDKVDINGGLFPLILFGSLSVIYFVLKYPQKIVRNIVLLIILGYFIQVGYGYIEGNGFESLRDRYVHSRHENYAEWASIKEIDLTAIKNYDERFKEDYYFGTKPPGVLFFYIVTQKISNLIQPETTFAGRYLRLTKFIAYVFPLLSFLVLITIYHIGKNFFEKETRVFPTILYIFFPNVLLMTLELDQVLFPFLFMLGFIFVKIATTKKSLPLAFIAGGMTYLVLFFSFSLLPLIVLSLSWFLIEYLLVNQERDFYALLKAVLGYVLAFIFFYFIFRIFINYDFFTRFVNSLDSHREIMGYEKGAEQLLKLILLNNVEFATWIGFPAMILYICRNIDAIRSILSRKRTDLDNLTIAFGITFLTLNVFGQTIGEVGRLWLFLVPMISIFASAQIDRMFKNKPLGLIGVVLLQLITVHLIYLFQDYF